MTNFADFDISAFNSNPLNAPIDDAEGFLQRINANKCALTNKVYFEDKYLLSEGVKRTQDAIYSTLETCNYPLEGFNFFLHNDGDLKQSFEDMNISVYHNRDRFSKIWKQVQEQITNNFEKHIENRKQNKLNKIKKQMEKQFGFIDDNTRQGNGLKYFYHDDYDVDWKGYALLIEGHRFTYRIIKTNKDKCELIRICNIGNKRKHYKNYTKSRIIEDMRLFRCCDGFQFDYSKKNKEENWDGKYKSNKEIGNDKDRISYCVKSE